ncbi:ASCH domain-containing protein [Qipengyuania flava]|uniref:ASCH domain-containing protein n=1 Tax=Qipengyuania flava TaxID=192812 RepID=UPI00178C4C4A|nr:ASCH domain-containing protein [Qipengyuania flava]
MTSVGEVLISIYPEYAAAIFRGEKTVELRRRIPGLKSGTKMWIYATRPVGAILGYAFVGDVSKGPPNIMWEIFGDRAAVGREKFDSYFSEADVAVCITLTGISEGRPLSADGFKTVRSGFHPPQLFTRLSEKESNFLSQNVFPQDLSMTI